MDFKHLITELLINLAALFKIFACLNCIIRFYFEQNTHFFLKYFVFFCFSCVSCPFMTRDHGSP